MFNAVMKLLNWTKKLELNQIDQYGIKIDHDHKPFIVQKRLTSSTRTSEYRPDPSGLKQQENKKPPHAPRTIPPLSQQKRTNSQDPAEHWCWSPTKNLGAGERDGDWWGGLGGAGLL